MRLKFYKKIRRICLESELGFRKVYVLIGFIVLTSCDFTPRRYPPFYVMPQTATILVSETLTLIPSYSMDLVTDWVSDNPEVATVKNGVVTGISTGKAEIQAFIGTTSTSPSKITVLAK